LNTHTADNVSFSFFFSWAIYFFRLPNFLFGLLLFGPFRNCQVTGTYNQQSKLILHKKKIKKGPAEKVVTTSVGTLSAAPVIALPYYNARRADMSSVDFSSSSSSSSSSSPLVGGCITGGGGEEKEEKGRGKVERKLAKGY
jgi:hypothetical protein